MNNSQALQLKRSVIMVSDLKRALSIYRDFLGFTENYRQMAETDTFSHLLFGIPPEISTDFITLDLGEQQRVLALVAVNDPTHLPKEPSRRARGSSGIGRTQHSQGTGPRTQMSTG